MVRLLCRRTRAHCAPAHPDFPLLNLLAFDASIFTRPSVRVWSSTRVDSLVRARRPGGRQTVQARLINALALDVRPYVRAQLSSPPVLCDRSPLAGRLAAPLFPVVRRRGTVRLVLLGARISLSGGPNAHLGAHASVVDVRRRVPRARRASANGQRVRPRLRLLVLRVERVTLTRIASSSFLVPVTRFSLNIPIARPRSPSSSRQRAAPS